MKKYEFQATNYQLATMMINAINASTPVGMGFLHFKPGNITVEEFVKNSLENENQYRDVDYYQGRMVKLYVRKNNEKYLFFGEPNPYYNSWSKKYPTYEELLNSANIPFEITETK